MSTIQIIRADDQPPQPWRNGGGQTRELLVWPPVPGSLGGNALCAGKGGACAAGGGHGAERIAAQTPTATQAGTEWQLRISRADIAASGPFSAFPGVQRWFVVLSGKGVVLHMPTADGHTRDHQLIPGHAPLHFDGGLAPGCSLISGPTQDLNLMARGDSATVLAVEQSPDWTCTFAMGGLYTAFAGTWSQGTQSVELAAHTLVWCITPDAAPMHFTPHHNQPAAAWWLGYTPGPTL
jgi:hypothetical protein